MAQLELELRLACTPGHAFKLFTERVDAWWPPGHRRRPDAAMMFEPGAKGRLFERSSSGDNLVGAITEWSPPHRIAFDWWLGVTENPTHVEIGFLASDLGTRVTILHTPGAALDDGVWDDRVVRFRSGWTSVFAALEDYAKAAA